MHLKKFLLFGLIAAVLPAVAEEAADRKTATSLTYVTHELDTRQNKFGVDTNKAMEYTNAAGVVQKRAVTSDLDNGGTESIPMVGGVNTKLNQKQDNIAAVNDHTAVTYTGQPGGIGRKGIYQTTGTYAEQSDNLIDAKTFNAALKNGLDSEFVCREDNRDPVSGLCWLYTIHNGTVVHSLPDGYTELEWIESDGTQYINTGHTHAQNETYEIDVMVDSVDSMYRSIIGAGSSGSSGYFYLSRTSNGMWLCNISKQPLVPIQTKLNLKFVENNNMVQLFVNGAQGPNAAISHYGTPLMLLARNATDAKTIGKLYGARIYDSTNSLVQNWVPARRNSDNVLGMYDSVNNVFKTNAATTGDDFTAGPVASTNIYIPQEQ